MDFKFECNRLAKDELAYQLAIRGFIDVGNVDEVRSYLKNERTDRAITKGLEQQKKRNSLLSKALKLLP